MQADSTLLDRIVGNTVIRMLSTGRSMPQVDAIVTEQDTCLLLGTTGAIGEPVASYPALVQSMTVQKARTPGSVIVQRAVPKRFISIIYDIEADPVCREEWILTALEQILEKCATYHINTLAMPLPGVMHGRIAAETAMQLILVSLQQRRRRYPLTLWISHRGIGCD